MPKLNTISSRNGFRFVLSLLLMVSFSACQLDSQKQIDKKTDETLQRDNARINAAAGLGLKNSELDPLSVSDDMWLGNQATRMHTGKPLPAKFEGNKGFTLISAAPVDLRTAASQISVATGIKTSVGDLTLSAAQVAPTPAPSSSSPTTNQNTLPPLPSLVETNTNAINVSYTGPLSKFLDQLADQMDVSWHYDGDQIYFYRYESKTFVVEALAGKASIQDQFSPSATSSSSGSSSGSSSSGAQDVTQKNNLTNDMDAWKDMEGAIKGILGTEGNEVMVPSSGTVVVTARPAKLDLIGKYIADENRRMTRQVAIDVVVYDVTTTSEDNYGIDIAQAFRTVGQTMGLSLSGNSPTSVLTMDGGVNDGSLSIGYLSSRWNGTAIIKALSSIGKTFEITRAPIVTLNNRAASRKIATDQTYIASESTTPSITAGVAPTATITPATVSSGIVLQVLPRMTNDDRILLQYSIIISTVNSIGQACADPAPTSLVSTTAATNCIGTPVTTSKVFVQQALLQNGATLVLAGFEKSLGDDQSEGVGNPYDWILGGVDAQNTRQQLVITITPREMTPERGNI